MPTTGGGNITLPPMFLDLAGGNLRLQFNSPCINAGYNSYVTTSMDFDGLPRIVRLMVDIGAYEFQGSGTTIFYSWLQHYGLPTDGSADVVDSDMDGMNNCLEWFCGTDPTNALSVLRLLSATPSGANLAVTWQSATGVIYFVERSTSLPFQRVFTPLATNIAGQVGTTTYIDTNAVVAEPAFYRVGINFR
jgi:hypothetical protein